MILLRYYAEIGERSGIQYLDASTVTVRVDAFQSFFPTGFDGMDRAVFVSVGREAEGLFDVDAAAVVLTAILYGPEDPIAYPLNRAGGTRIANVGGNRAGRMQRPLARKPIGGKQGCEGCIARRLGQRREEIPPAVMEKRSRIYRRA